MAANQVVGVNSQSKENDINQGKYKCCVTKECSVKVCMNCYSLYHKSCAERLANLKVIDANKIICCGKIILDKCDTPIEQQQEYNEENWKLENKYLKKLLEEVKEKNSILIENNNLLKEKVQNLNDQLINLNVNSETEAKSVTKKEVQTKTLSRQINPKKGSQETDLSKTRTNEQHTQKNIQNIMPYKQMELSADNTTNKKQTAYHDQLQQLAGCSQTTNMAIPRLNLEDLEQQQRRIMTDIINMAPIEQSQNKYSTEQSNNDTGVYNWQVAKSKKKPSKKNIGQSEDCTKFKGVEPKVWMYLSRITENVTEEDIREYLKLKTNDANGKFIIKDLKEPGKKLKSYVVAADFKYKTEFYQPSFWPRGVRYRRFNFKLYQEKYNTRNIIGNDIDNPDSFLGVISQKPVKKT